VTEILTHNEFQTLGVETEIQMLSCDGGLKADEQWKSAETSWVRDGARCQRDMAGDQCARLWRSSGKFKPYMQFSMAVNNTCDLSSVISLFVLLLASSWS